MPYLDIEEISQKAGNFKKFTVFVKMLCSGLSRETDSVFVDLLTYHDLEMLKSRRSGVPVSSTGSVSTMSVNSSVSKVQMKRYIILTYAGEFDRVHFPLPLGYQDSPNPLLLLKTIKRLRRQLHQQQEPSSSRER